MKNALKHADTGFPSNDLTECGYLRLPQVLEILPIGRSTFWAKVKAEIYPKPVKISERVTAWRISDIQDLVAKIEAGEV